eukprot:TRINITY_DN21121_c0_g3_i1.p1 TRINITY_DN21121_c0_g3~~TRINITY_DN21121_c0_g3_i1.p1  ORF type:complete len:636 (-),score=113.04 TRINITY_DN21121_c0_g3_i1:51-1958(-)
MAGGEAVSKNLSTSLRLLMEATRHVEVSLAHLGVDPVSPETPRGRKRTSSDQSANSVMYGLPFENPRCTWHPRASVVERGRIGSDASNGLDAVSSHAENHSPGSRSSASADLPAIVSESDEPRHLSSSPITLDKKMGMSVLTENAVEVSHVAQALRRFSNYIALKHSDSTSLERLARLYETVSRYIGGFINWWEHLFEPPRRGHAAQFEHSWLFGCVSSLMILMNAGFIAYTSEWEIANYGQPAPGSFEVVDLVFLIFFTVELLLRLWVHRLYFFVNREWVWNLIDMSLVGTSLLGAMLSLTEPEGTDSGNIGYMRIIRLLKIVKIIRSFRVVKVFRELALMLESFLKCFVSMFWALLMLAFLLYVFALVFLQGFSGYLASAEPSDQKNIDLVVEQFGSLAKTMLALYMSVTGGNDWIVFYRTTELAGSFYSSAFLIFTFIFGFALFNILTGIFVEKAVVASQPDREDLVLEQRRRSISEAKEFYNLCLRLDLDGTGTITLEEFKENMTNETVISYMASVGLEVYDVELFFRILAGPEEDADIPIDTFVQGCMAMRGTATGLDLQKQIHETLLLKDRLRKFEDDTLAKMDELVQISRRVCDKVYAGAPSRRQSSSGSSCSSTRQAEVARLTSEAL